MRKHLLPLALALAGAVVASGPAWADASGGPVTVLNGGSPVTSSNPLSTNSGYTVLATASAITVANSSHAVGTSLGGLISIPTAVPATGWGGTLHSLTMAFADGLNPSVDVVLFGQNPTSSTITDGSAVSIAAADLPKIIGVFQPTVSVLLGASSPLLLQDQVNSLTFGGLTSTTLYAAVIVRGSSVTPAANDMTMQMRVYQDHAQ